MIRLTILLLMAAICAGCTTGERRTTNQADGTGDPYFDCRTAAYARTHTDVCSGILR
jgi:hypothetical protein